MGDQLLVRAYNVGCGDCIYVRIPAPKDGFHILIDCGKKGGDELLDEGGRSISKRSSRPGRRRARSVST